MHRPDSSTSWLISSFAIAATLRDRRRSETKRIWELSRTISDSHAGDANAGDRVICDLAVAISQVRTISRPCALRSTFALIGEIVDGCDLDLSPAPSEAQSEQKQDRSLQISVFAFFFPLPWTVSRRMEISRKVFSYNYRRIRWTRSERNPTCFRRYRSEICGMTHKARKILNIRFSCLAKI